ncbi:MAG: aldo/keto reductase [Lachnospiraceae bacterium]|nr:aldo/keto reductase [Lachnospiraceae bacterium]
MKQITLGTTGIIVPQNGFGALPVQRISSEAAVSLLRRAYTGGIRFFDTARGYTDSEEKLGLAFGDGYVNREEIYLASKTPAKKPEDFWKDLETCLATLKTEYIDIYQFHCAGQVYAPGDGTGMYECMLEAKKQGKIRHIGITAHKIQVAIDAANSGLYETIQFPFSYIATEKEMELVELCREKNIGFIAMKGLAGGLINNSAAAMAFMNQFDHVLPIWGMQKEEELDQWLSYMENTPEMTQELKDFIEKEKQELSGSFCRGCGYCMPCPQGIEINTCARMYLMLRRAQSDMWLTKEMQEKMAKVENCTGCRKCVKKCPYGLETPELLKWNLEDYKKVLKGEVKVTAE